MLVHHLCDIKVPVLCDVEVAGAMELFKVIDAAFPKEGGFMSYAYALEFILCKMNRELAAVPEGFSAPSGARTTNSCSLGFLKLSQSAKPGSFQVRRYPTSVPKLRPSFQIRLLPWHKPCYRVDPSTCSRWWVWCNIYLIEQDRARTVLRKVLKSLEV